MAMVLPAIISADGEMPRCWCCCGANSEAAAIIVQEKKSSSGCP